MKRVSRLRVDIDNLKRSGDLAFVTNVVIAYLSALIISPRLFTQPEGFVLILLGVVYTLIGVYGFSFFTRIGLPLPLHFGIEIALGAVILFLSRYVGAMWLILLPFAGYSLALPRHWMVLVCALIVIAFGAPMGLLFGWGQAFLSSIAYLAGLAFVVLFVRLAMNEQHARHEIERMATELSEANRKLREYAAQAEELAIAKERNRLAREIHDSLGHYLTVINVQLEAARLVMDSDRKRALDALNKAQRLVQDGLAEVRRSVATLRASQAEIRPLPEAVAMVVEECRTAGIFTELVIHGTPRPLPPQTELTLYRAAQEGLTNVRKHAHASRAEVLLDYRDLATVRLVVQDNGVGCHKPDGGFGLLGLQERVSLVGGEFRIITAPGQGFTLEMTVPG